MTRPTEPGWYWFDFAEGWDKVQVIPTKHKSPNALLVIFPDGTKSSLDELNDEWWGPHLEPPQDLP